MIVALAILGAVIATIGGILGGRSANPSKLARTLLWTGYAVSGVSVILFIVAGFLSNR